MKQRFTIDDLLLVAFLTLTIWHSAHILAGFELPGLGWLAWPLAIGVDIGIARAAWVCAGRTLPSGARWVAGGWLCFLLVASYGLNISFYAERGATVWAWALASLFPVSLAAAGAVKSFLSQKQEPLSQPAPAPIPDETTANLVEALRLQLHEAQSDIKRLQAQSVKEPVTLAGLVEMPELVTAGAADSGIDRSQEIVNNGSREQLLDRAYSLVKNENYSQRAAASEVNIPLSTFRDWLSKKKE